jgi:hypothetical protein
VFLHGGTTVGGEVETSSTFQVFVFDSTVGDDIEVHRTSDIVNICGNLVADDIEVTSSGRDILVGDPAAPCAGNTVGDDIEVERNNVDVELIVRGNTVADDLEVNRNRGPADKFVQDNTGGDKLECRDNEEPFVGAPNSGFARVEGDQCALI